MISQGFNPVFAVRRARLLRHSVVPVACLIVLGLVAVAAPALASAASERLEASIAFHDPDGRWADGSLRLELDELRPEGEDRRTTVDIRRGGAGEGSFRLVWRTENHVRVGTLDPSAGRCEWTLDGSAEIPEDTREELGLTCERLRWLRDYYLYLWGLPMKLTDPGTVLADAVEREYLDGQPVDVLSVTYEPEVGDDRWRIYLAPESAEVVAYRFYSGPEGEDGELVRLEGLVEGAGLRLPARRTWTTNRDGRLLGTDVLRSITALAPTP